MLKNKPIPLFLFVTFSITWGMWIPALLTKLNGGTSLLGPDTPTGQFARWAPGITAILVTWFAVGKTGIGPLIKPIKIWRVNLGWYLFALFFQPALFFVTRTVDRWLGNTYDVVSPLSKVDAPIAFVIPVVILTALPGAFMEELGWRGFILPRLQSKYSALMASVLLGLIWGVWHIPSIIYLGETNISHIALAVVNTIPITVLYTWLFNNTQQSLFLVSLFHASQQYSNNFLGTIPTFTSDALVWSFAIVITILEGTKYLSRRKLQYIGVK